ncbi:DNA-binding protein WhiA [Lachnoanaerobaculum umeaense]|uniref:Probable cell division protein WhiA n=1 Tax=Lachnoanaerobaculum umeaense TaxID=617123 RepID=A0A385PYT1_9FIRM|nr:DNA-binding protein WhiA [Lachnoanaerobaculum umeaense]AYA98729.1 DNA-binding protein WhiA [Lachnoanaerobaculum umeaense]PZW99975.1 hypothetical protein C7439_10172 [Lachnoanaerobaculum umeaense]
MTFSSEVKNELIRVNPTVRHCILAEILAIVYFIGTVSTSKNNEISLQINTEYSGLARKYFTLIKKTFNINTDVVVSNSALVRRKRLYSVSIMDDAGAREVLKAIKLLKNQELLDCLSLRSNTVLLNSCCKKAFFRGAFLSSGSITDPEKGYHLEIVCSTIDDALSLKELMEDLSLKPKITTRKKANVVYIKDSDQISLALGLMEAPTSLMNFENIRILKGMRNDVNRKVNCETANINKTVSAALSQLEDIQLIKEIMGLEKLTSNLEAVANARLENPDASLVELGKMISPQLGKSGVNHRLRKLSIIADQLREKVRRENG